MAERFQPEQQRIKSVKEKAAKPTEAKEEKEWKTQSLYEKIESNYSTFTSSVSSINKDLDAANGLRDSNNRDAFFGGSGYATAIREDLLNVAKAGESAYKLQLRDNAARGELATIDQRASSINTQVEEIPKVLPFMQVAETADQMFKTDATPQIEAVLKLLLDKSNSPVEKRDMLVKGADEAIDKIAEAKKTLTKIPKSAVPEIWHAAYDEYLKPIDERLEQMGSIKLYYEVRDFASSDKYEGLLTFNEENGEVIVTDAFKKMPDEERQKILLELHLIKKRIADQIDEKCIVDENERNFFEGKRMLESGDWVSAKAALLQYWNEGNRRIEAGTEANETAERLIECKEMLKQIALLELAQARQRLQLIKSSIEARFGDFSLKPGDNLPIGTTHDMADLYIRDMEVVLGKAEEMISSGESVELEDVYKKLREMEAGATGPLRRFQTGFANMGKHNLIFDVLRAQAELNNETDPEKRKQQALEQAKKAEEMGLNDLARHYYDIYFSEEISENATKVSREEIAAGMKKDSEVMEQLDEHVKLIIEDAKKQFEKKNGREMSAQEVKDLMGVYRPKLFGMMVDKAYTKAVKALVHQGFQNNESSRAKAWNSVYGNTFVNLDTYGQKWYQFWKFSAEEWDQFKVFILLDIGTMIAGGGIASKVVESTVKRQLMKALIKKGVQKAVVEEAVKAGGKRLAALTVKELGVKKAAAYGITHLAVESGTSHIVHGTLNGMVHSDFSMYSSPRKFFGSWGKMAIMMGAGKVTNFGFSFRKPPTSVIGHANRYFAEAVADETFSAGVELGLMAISGEELTDDKVARLLKDNVVYAVGLRAGQKIVKPGGGRQDAETRRIIDAEAKRTVAEASEKMGIDFNNPASIREASVDAEGRIVINGKTLRGFDTEMLPYLPKEAREKVTNLVKDAEVATSEKTRTEAPRLTSFETAEKEGSPTSTVRESTPKEETAAEPTVIEARSPFEKAKIDQIRNEAMNRLRNAGFAKIRDMVENLRQLDDTLFILNRSDAIPNDVGWIHVTTLPEQKGTLMMSPDGKIYRFADDVSQFDYEKSSRDFGARMGRYEEYSPHDRANMLYRRITRELDWQHIPAEMKDTIARDFSPATLRYIEEPDKSVLRELSEPEYAQLRLAIHTLKNAELKSRQEDLLQRAQHMSAIAERMETKLREEMVKNPDLTREEMHELLDVDNHSDVKSTNLTPEQTAKIHFVIDSLYDSLQAGRDVDYTDLSALSGVRIRERSAKDIGDAETEAVASSRRPSTFEEADTEVDHSPPSSRRRPSESGKTEAIPLVRRKPKAEDRNKETKAEIPEARKKPPEDTMSRTPMEVPKPPKRRDLPGEVKAGESVPRLAYVPEASPAEVHAARQDALGRLERKFKESPNLEIRVEAVIEKHKLGPDHLNNLDPVEIRLLTDSDPSYLNFEIVEKIVTQKYETFPDFVDGRWVNVRYYTDTGKPLGVGGFGTVTEGYCIVLRDDGMPSENNGLRHGAIKELNEMVAPSMANHPVSQYEQDTNRAIRDNPRDAYDQGFVKPIYVGRKAIRAADGHIIRFENVIISEKINSDASVGQPDLDAMSKVAPAEKTIGNLATALIGVRSLHEMGKMHWDIKLANFFTGLVNGKPVAVLGDLAGIPFSALKNIDLGPIMLRDGTTVEIPFFQDGNGSLPVTPKYFHEAYKHVRCQQSWLKAHPEATTAPPHIVGLADIALIGNSIKKIKNQYLDNPGMLPESVRQQVDFALRDIITDINRVPDMDKYDEAMRVARESGDSNAVEAVRRVRDAELAKLEDYITVEQIQQRLNDIADVIRDARGDAAPIPLVPRSAANPASTLPATRTDPGIAAADG